MFPGHLCARANSEKNARKEMHGMIPVCGGLDSTSRPPALGEGGCDHSTVSCEQQCPEAAPSCTLMRWGGHNDHHVQGGSSLPTYTWL